MYSWTVPAKTRAFDVLLQDKAVLDVLQHNGVNATLKVCTGFRVSLTVCVQPGWITGLPLFSQVANKDKIAQNILTSEAHYHISCMLVQLWRHPKVFTINFTWTVHTTSTSHQWGTLFHLHSTNWRRLYKHCTCSRFLVIIPNCAFHFWFTPVRHLTTFYQRHLANWWRVCKHRICSRFLLDVFPNCAFYFK